MILTLELANFMKESKVYYGDFKPKNLLIDQGYRFMYFPKTPQTLKLKVTDFGGTLYLNDDRGEDEPFYELRCYTEKYCQKEFYESKRKISKRELY